MGIVSPIDQRALRNCLGTFVTGVTVVTTLDRNGSPVGVTANSFSSVSLEPPLVLWSQALASRSFAAFRDAERFTINILAAEQAHISQRFARSGIDKFLDTKVRSGIGGLPIIEGAVAVLECRKVAIYPGGDHAVFLGEVENFEHTDLKPLAFGGGRYMLTLAHDLGSYSFSSSTTVFTHVDGVRLACAALPAISERLDTTVGLAVWGNRGATVIAWEPSRNPVFPDLRTGMVVSPLLAASGLVFSAFLPPETARRHIDRELDGMRAGGIANIPSLESIESILATVRTLGVSHSVPERFGRHITAYGAPVFDAPGQVAFALTAVGAKERIGDSQEGEFPKRLIHEAAQLSQKLISAKERAADKASASGTGERST